MDSWNTLSVLRYLIKSVVTALLSTRCKVGTMNDDENKAAIDRHMQNVRESNTNCKK